MGDQHQPALNARSQRPPAGAARSVQPPAPFELTEEVDTAARTKSALFLQSSAGNRAVASTLAQVRGASRQQDALRVVGSPTSTAAPPRGGVVQISNAAAGMHAAGYTSLPAPGAPDVVLRTPLQQSDGGWQATINPTTVTPDPATSLYPGEGLHDDEPTPDGTRARARRDQGGFGRDQSRRGRAPHGPGVGAPLRLRPGGRRGQSGRRFWTADRQDARRREGSRDVPRSLGSPGQGALARCQAAHRSLAPPLRATCRSDD